MEIKIPPAALEAGARAIREFYSDEPVAVCDGVAYKAARAAFEAMVGNWEGAMFGNFPEDDKVRVELILPITETSTKENNNG